MKKMLKVIPMSLALAMSFSFVGGVFTRDANLSYASSETNANRNRVQKYSDQDAKFRKSEEYQQANDALKKIYELNMEYAKELLANPEASESEFESIAKEIRSAKNSINDTSNPMLDSAKLRVDLRLQMITAKDLLYMVPREDYNKDVYDALSLEYGKALNLYEKTSAKDSELVLAKINLQKASEKFEKENNSRAYLIRLQEAMKLNKIKADLARDYLKRFPKTMAPIKAELEKLIEESDRLLKEATEGLNKYL